MHRRIPAPQPDPESAPYWQAAAEGRLLIRRCTGCGEAHHYPRSFCPFCFCGDTRWEEVSGRGTIYTFSVMRRAAVPYAIAYVTLAEGPTMMTNIVEADLDSLRIGQPVELLFQDSDAGPPVPMFRRVQPCR